MKGSAVIALSFLAGTAGGLAGGLWGASLIYRAALEEIELLSPVVVLDATPMLERIQVRSNPNEIASVLERVRDQARRLKEKGFVVLRPSAVMEAPESIYVKVDTP